jgi:formate/nitrite transporter
MISGACQKATADWGALLILGVLAGSYIAFGAQLATIVTFDAPAFVGTGITKMLFGAAFSLGLMLVVVGGAELFTGNNLIVMGCLDGQVSWGAMLRNWCIVYGSNFLGAMLIVLLVLATGLWKTGEGALGLKALMIANDKVQLGFGEALARGVLCNWLVCLAVWLATAAKDVVSKMLAIFFPIMAFVASGFEHSIANMYFIPMGILLKSKLLSAVAAPAELAATTADLTWDGFLVHNLLPVTIGNVVGGAFFVGCLYWFAYRTLPRARSVSARQLSQ